MIKIIVILAFILILISLGSALLHLIQHKTEEDSEKTVKALTFRIALSLVLFVFVFIMVATGLYKPQGIGAGMLMQKPIATENNK
jgi:uncharacterized membrane protein